METTFKKIGLFGRVKNPGVKETLKALIHYLQELKSAIWVENETAEPLNDPSIQTISRDEIGSFCDLLIVVGGDGSLLHAAHAIVNQGIPVVGINRGSLGFLTDIHPAELFKIKPILEGQYLVEERFLLNLSIESQESPNGNDYALNEVAIIPDTVPHMIEFEIYIDQQFVCSQHSDGLIIATPTGSTAYALSGGGPILHPELNAIVLVPMFSHSLNSRPIVIDANRTLEIKITPNNSTSPRVSCDGRAYLKTQPGDQIRIQKKKEKLHLIHPLDYNYYEALRSKLHWGKKLHYLE